MSYFPIVVDLAGKSCLVVGGGEIALRKARSLVDAGARVRVIAPEIDARVEQLEGVEIVRRGYEAGDVEGCALVFAATDDRALNAAVYREADAKGVLVNAVDDPEISTFISPSVVRRGDLMIAVTTSGKSPTLAKRMRKELEERFGPEYAAFVELLGEYRDQIKTRYSSPKDRERAFSKLIDSGILELLREGKSAEAAERASKCI